MPPARPPELSVGLFFQELTLSRLLGSLRSKTPVLLQQYRFLVGQIVFCCGVLGNAVATTKRETAAKTLLKCISIVGRKDISE